MICYSKSLVNLSISVNTFDDCFYQLRNLCVLIRQIDTPSLSINVFIKKIKILIFQDVIQYEIFLFIFILVHK
jgi:hypothetical protein